MIKVFTNFKEALSSFDVVAKRELGFKTPGRVRGFDVMEVAGLVINIKHTNTGINQVPKIPTDPPALVGVLYTRQGCIIQMDEDLIFNGTSNGSNPFPRIEKVICKHTYIDSEGGSSPEFRLDTELYTLLANEILIGRIITPANATTYASSSYIPEFYDLDYQHRVKYLLQKLQSNKTIISTNRLVLDVNTTSLLVVASSYDLYYISDLGEGKEIEFIYQGDSGKYIRDYSNTADAPFGFLDLATPDGADVLLIPKNTYKFQWVMLTGFTGWLLINSSSGSKIKTDATDNIPGFLNDKLDLDSGSGLIKSVIATGGPLDRIIRLSTNRDYPYNNYIIDNKPYNETIGGLDSVVLHTLKAFLQNQLPLEFLDNKLVLFSGCSISISASPKTISYGYAYYNNNFYYIPANSFTPGGSEIGVWSIGPHDNSGMLIMNFAAGLPGTGLFDETSNNILYYNFPLSFNSYQTALHDFITINGLSTAFKFASIIPFGNKAKIIDQTLLDSTKKYKPLMPGWYKIRIILNLSWASGDLISAEGLELVIVLNDLQTYFLSYANTDVHPITGTDDKSLKSFILVGDFLYYFNGTSDYFELKLLQGNDINWNFGGQLAIEYTGKSAK